jgi:hypothetical protein
MGLNILTKFLTDTTLLTPFKKKIVMDRDSKANIQQSKVIFHFLSCTNLEKLDKMKKKTLCVGKINVKIRGKVTNR